MYKYWQPPGCMLHDYKVAEIEKCLGCTRIVLVGDSTMRQLFWAMARKINNADAVNASLNAPRHANLQYMSGCAGIHFLWDPFLNSSGLQTEMRWFSNAVSPYRDDLRPPGVGVWLPEATMIVFGGGLWHARHLNNTECARQFSHTVSNITSYMKTVHEDPAHGIDSGQAKPPRAQRLLLAAPVPAPDYVRLSTERKASITPEKIASLNNALDNFAKHDGLDVLNSFTSMTKGRHTAYETSGLHVIDSVADRQADIVLNMKCNNMPALQHFPFDKTCCSETRQPGFWQHVPQYLSMGVVLKLLTQLLKFRSCPADQRQVTAQRIKAIIIFCSAVFFCYCADRSWIFEKMNKVPDEQLFLLASSASLILGLLTISSSSPVRATQQENTATNDSTNFLSREQTEEWKGWMQLIVLAYHYFGMSQVLWIYEVIRTLVASYLFMTGFGHTVYFHTTNDFSLRRVASVLIRMNLLAYSLSISMRTNYEFYYFPALSSFWFMVIYLTCKINIKPGAVSWLLLIKILISSTLVTAAVETPGILESMFWVLKMICRVQLDVHELRFRVVLDMYIVYIGMVCAMVYLQFTGVASCSKHCISYWLRRYLHSFRVIGVLIAVVTLPGYFILIQLPRNKYDYNRLHPKLSFLPILSYVVLRNCHSKLRTHHSRLFALVGRCSLETFVLQYHIWLAGDTKGLLRLGLFGRGGLMLHGQYNSWGRWVEFAIITIYFFWTSWGVGKATTVITQWIVGLEYQGRKIEARTSEQESNERRDIFKPSQDLPILPLSSKSKIEKGRFPHWKLGLSGPSFEVPRLRNRILIIFVGMWIINLVCSLPPGWYSEALLT